MHGIEKPYYATPGDGIFHFYFPEQGLVLPGQFIPGADSHTRAYGAYGAVGIGVGSTTLGFGWSTGYIYFTMAKQRRVALHRRCSPWVTGKDIVLELLRRWGAKQSQGMSVELVDVDQQLPMAYRNTIANMMAEAEALNGIFAPDEITYAWYRAKGMTELPYPPISAAARTRVFEIDEELSLGDVDGDDRQAVQSRQRVSGRGGRARADHVRQGDDRLVHQRQLRRSAVGGARAAWRRASKGLTKAPKEFVVFPGSGGVKLQIERPDPRLGGESIADVFRARRRRDPRARGAGRASARAPTRSPKASARSRRSIATGRTAWASAAKAISPSPSVVAASALVGYMAPPSELGLEWDPEKYGV